MTDSQKIDIVDIKVDSLMRMFVLLPALIQAPHTREPDKRWSSTLEELYKVIDEFEDKLKEYYKTIDNE